jgi:hypothetical protein
MGLIDPAHTRLLTRNLSGAGKTYSRVVAFVMQLLKPILGGKTPRKFWLSEHKMVCDVILVSVRNRLTDIWSKQDSMKFGVVWPPIALIVVIVIVYSVIQPVITGVGLLVMALLWFAYKYVLGWCADQPDEVSPGCNPALLSGSANSFPIGSSRPADCTTPELSTLSLPGSILRRSASLDCSS